MMNHKTTRLLSGQDKEVDDGTNVNDFISKMPDDVLVMILSRLHVKHAAVTSGLSTRWRFLWRNVIRLSFVREQHLGRNKYINQVNEVIHSYNNPKVQSFHICFSLDNSSSEHINEWVRFALGKKVENLEIDLLEKFYNIRDDLDANYDFLLPSSIATVGKILSLQKLCLKGVNINASTLNEILKNSPHLTVLYMCGSYLFPDIHVGGRDVNLKHLEFVSCSGIESISLYRFDLVSFAYRGSEIKFYLSDLPKLKKLEIGEVSVVLKNNVFSQISSCALYLQVLILDMWSPKRGLDVNTIIKFPNVKKLLLAMNAEEDDSLLEFTSIAQACPRLETFAISLYHHYEPKHIRTEVRRVATPHRYEHLKLLEIFGYYGRISDLELAVYVIENAVALKKIVIDPCFHDTNGYSPVKEVIKGQKVARFLATHQLTPILPPGVDLAINSQPSKSSVTVGLC